VLTVVDHPGHDPDPCRPPRPEARGGDLGAIDHRHLAADLRVDTDAGGLEVAGDLTTGFFSAIASRAFSSGAAGNIDITADSSSCEIGLSSIPRAWAPAAAAISWNGAGRSAGGGRRSPEQCTQ
jgi:hypothetical protein